MNPAFVFNAILGLLLVIGTGFALAATGRVPEAAQAFIPKLITRVSLPAMLGTVFLRLDPAEFPSLLRSTALPFTSIGLSLGIAWALGKIARVEKRHFGLYCACFSISNTMYIGLPFCVAIFGEAAIPHVLVYYFANTTFFWTVGNFLVSSDALDPALRRPRHIDTLRRLLSPPMLGLMAGVCIWRLNIPLPSCVIDAARCLGSLTTPLALLFIGMALAKAKIRSALGERDVLMAVGGRLLLCPCIMWLLLRLFPCAPLTGTIFILNAGLPVLMQSAVLSAYYKTDAEYGALAISVSTFLSVITLPLLLFLADCPPL